MRLRDPRRVASSVLWSALVLAFKGAIGVGVLTWAAYGALVQIFGMKPTEPALSIAFFSGALAGVLLAIHASRHQAARL